MQMRFGKGFLSIGWAGIHGDCSRNVFICCVCVCVVLSYFAYRPAVYTLPHHSNSYFRFRDNYHSGTGPNFMDLSLDTDRLDTGYS